jgi:hypothetical protein
MRLRMLLPACWLPALAVAALGFGDLAFADTAGTAALDRIAYAVDGAESSHGKDAGMWRQNLAGPQGPMQVGQKAALDVGSGDRFDVVENRAIGRALFVPALSALRQLVGCDYGLQLGHG